MCSGAWRYTAPVTWRRWHYRSNVIWLTAIKSTSSSLSLWLIDGRRICQPKLGGNLGTDDGCWLLLCVLGTASLVKSCTTSCMRNTPLVPFSDVACNMINVNQWENSTTTHFKSVYPWQFEQCCRISFIPGCLTFSDWCHNVDVYIPVTKQITLRSDQSSHLGVPSHVLKFLLFNEVCLSKFLGFAFGEAYQ